jgi:hypothetical protein
MLAAAWLLRVVEEICRMFVLNFEVLRLEMATEGMIAACFAVPKDDHMICTRVCDCDFNFLCKITQKW